jgi:hypothetical protein
MASGLYAKTKKLILDADLDLLVDDIRAILVDTADYSVDLAAHDFLDDVAAGARVAVSSELTNKSTTGGVFDADDVTWSSVTGDQCEAVILYKHTGTDSTSPLIAYIDSFSSGMPVTPNGGNITCQWDSGANKIFKI